MTKTPEDTTSEFHTALREIIDRMGVLRAGGKAASDVPGMTRMLTTNTYRVEALAQYVMEYLEDEEPNEEED